MTNREIADHFRQRARQLAHQGDNLYRIRAFRQAAMTVLALPEEIQILLQRRGSSALERLPGLGPGLVTRILELTQWSSPAGQKTTLTCKSC